MHPFCCEWGRPVAECNFMFTWNYWYTNRHFLLIHDVLLIYDFLLIQIFRIQRGSLFAETNEACHVCQYVLYVKERCWTIWITLTLCIYIASVEMEKFFQIPPGWYYSIPILYIVNCGIELYIGIRWDSTRQAFERNKLSHWSFSWCLIHKEGFFLRCWEAFQDVPSA